MRNPFIIGYKGKLNSIVPLLPFNPRHKPMPSPTLQMLNNDPLFEAIWATIKDWDINVPACYIGYCGGNGSHVAMIYEAIVKSVKSVKIG